MKNIFSAALTTFFLIFSIVSNTATGLTKENIVDYAAMIDVCEENSHISKSDIKELLFPRTRMWAHKNLSDKEKKQLKGAINLKKNKITSVTEKSCKIVFNELMKLPTKFKSPFSPVPKSKLTGKEIQKEKKLISSACPNFISAAIDIIKIGRKIEKKGKAKINDFRRTAKVAEFYSNKINAIVIRLKQENRLKYFFTSEKSIRDYQKYSERMLVDQLQGDKLAYIQNSMDLSFVVCRHLGFKF